jgi:phosphomannomutase
MGYKSFSETGDETGGLKVHISDKSWIWYRGSKTELGVFRILADAKSLDEANRLLKLGEEVVLRVK